jgi:hypothetical protein
MIHRGVFSEKHLSINFFPDSICHFTSAVISKFLVPNKSGWHSKNDNKKILNPVEHISVFPNWTNPAAMNSPGFWGCHRKDWSIFNQKLQWYCDSQKQKADSSAHREKRFPSLYFLRQRKLLWGGYFFLLSTVALLPYFMNSSWTADSRLKLINLFWCHPQNLYKFNTNGRMHSGKTVQHWNGLWNFLIF